jgi:hypothetical protein
MHSVISYKVSVLQGGYPIKNISAQMGGYAHLNHGWVKIMEQTDRGTLLCLPIAEEQKISTRSFLTQP